MNDDPTPEQLKRAEEVHNHVGKLMLKAGWITHMGRTSSEVGFAWTEKGTQASKVLRVIFDELGGDLTGEELAAVLAIIDGISPGHTTNDAPQ